MNPAYAYLLIIATVCIFVLIILSIGVYRALTRMEDRSRARVTLLQRAKNDFKKNHVYRRTWE